MELLKILLGSHGKINEATFIKQMSIQFLEEFSMVLEGTSYKTAEEIFYEHLRVIPNSNLAEIFDVTSGSVFYFKPGRILERTPSAEIFELIPREIR